MKYFITAFLLFCSFHLSQAAIPLSQKQTNKHLSGKRGIDHKPSKIRSLLKKHKKKDVRLRIILTSLILVVGGGLLLLAGLVLWSIVPIVVGLALLFGAIMA